MDIKHMKGCSTSFSIAETANCPPSSPTFDNRTPKFSQPFLQLDVAM